MKKRVKYTEGEMGKFRVIENFLPPPEELILKEDTVKVTISLSQSSVDFFKKHAKINHVPYQKMIKSLLDTYAENYTGP